MNEAPIISAIPTRVGTTPGRVGITPGRVGTIPGRVGITPGHVGITPGRVGITPERVGAIPGRVGVIPVNAGAVPVNAGAVPVNAGAVPVNAGAIPVNAGAIPVNAGAVPVNAGAVPVNAGAVPVNAGAIPVNAGIAAITLYQPKKIVFGTGILAQFSDECRSEGHKRILLIYTTPLKPQAEAIAEALVREMGSAEACFLLEYAYGEPTIAYFRSLLEEARRYGPDCVAGLGGGSVLDTAKLLAALWNNAQDVVDVFGKNLLTGRKTGLICIPTTSGTGSEVSPNAILLDEETGEKKAVISPALVPDSCFIDPALMAGLPPNVTAETGMDALSHCIEAYTNRFSHPLVDVYALAGIRLIGSHLERAYREPSDMEARAALAMGSLYGGLCLGPVNTAAVHALSYGLGGQYHVSHGLANAMLLPTVMRFNLEANPQKYKDIGEALGAESALEGVERLSALSVACGIPQKLSDLGIAAEEVETLADLAMKVTRLLNNNPREVTREYAINLYKQLF